MDEVMSHEGGIWRIAEKYELKIINFQKDIIFIK